MSRTKFLSFIIFIFFGLIAGGVSQWPDGSLHLVMCDVGQGDAILMTQGFTQILVDGGPNQRVSQCLSDHLPFWDRTIELIVATHPDKDHIAGLINVIDNYKVISFVSVNEANDTTVFADLRALVQEKRLTVHIARRDEAVSAGKIKLKILSPETTGENFLVWSENFDDKKPEQVLSASASSSSESSNDQSVVLRASFDAFDVLLTGDIGTGVERQLVADQNLSGIEVLKVSHHGSKYATSQEFLENLKPQLALIGVGKNQWGHPAGEVLERLRNLGIKTLRTDVDGEIEIISDGNSWYIE